MYKITNPKSDIWPVCVSVMYILYETLEDHCVSYQNSYILYSWMFLQDNNLQLCILSSIQITIMKRN